MSPFLACGPGTYLALSRHWVGHGRRRANSSGNSGGSTQNSLPHGAPTGDHWTVVAHADPAAPGIGAMLVEGKVHGALGSYGGVGGAIPADEPPPRSPRNWAGTWPVGRMVRVILFTAPRGGPLGESKFVPGRFKPAIELGHATRASPWTSMGTCSLTSWTRSPPGWRTPAARPWRRLHGPSADQRSYRFGKVQVSEAIWGAGGGA
jgi:hypothetical protein